ncbi:MAG: PTS sugar transporter subunit IIB [Syntrophorhabdaceae bacterium]|nr:PTS sugar transporter subunit IIB [Syntrophorhabdaceae bacterium]
MSLVLARIDCRLVHGQVVETWIQHVKANSLIVANDAVVDNPMMRSVMELAVPVEVKVRFCRLDQAIEMIKEADLVGERSILLISNASDAIKIRKSGARFTNLNIGNLYFEEGKVQITPSVFFAPEDFEALQWFRSNGVSVCVKGTPFESGVLFEAEG